jgi:hypothetical protein
MKRITITVSDTQHPLAQGQEVDTIEAAALAFGEPAVFDDL